MQSQYRDALNPQNLLKSSFTRYRFSSCRSNYDGEEDPNVYSISEESLNWLTFQHRDCIGCSWLFDQNCI